LPVGLYGCETLPLTFRDEHRLRVLENRELQRMYGPKKDEIIGGWRKFHKEKLHNLCSLPNIIRMSNSGAIRWAQHEACIRVLVGNPEGDLQEDLDIGGWKILKWILEKKDWIVWTGII
jgi:hypothetical protein